MTPNVKYLRRLKASDLLKKYENYCFREDDLHIEYCPNATILPLKRFDSDTHMNGRGGVIDANGNYVALSAAADKVEGGYDFDTAEVRTQRVMYCGYFNPAWGHFLLDTFPRLWYILDYDITSIDKFIFITSENKHQEIQGNFAELLRLVGISDKVEIINRPIRYSEVVISELGFDLENYVSNSFNRLVDYVVSNALNHEDNCETHDKIFLTRSAFPKAIKYEFGMPTIDNFFSRNGFEIIHPEKLSLSRLIRLLNNASTIASMTGTVAHNMLWTTGSSKTIIVEKHPINNRYQPGIDKLRGLCTTYIDAHISIHSVSPGLGPFIYSFNHLFKEYAHDNGLIPTENKYADKSYIHKCLKWYMKAYKRFYRYQWYVDTWFEDEMPILVEAYNDSFKTIGQWLNGSEPLFLTDAINPIQLMRKIMQYCRKNQRLEFIARKTTQLREKIRSLK